MNFQSRVALAPATASSLRPAARRLQRKCACGGTAGPAGECEPCRKKRLERAARSGAPPSPGLTINESAASEAEADAMAARVVSGQPIFAPSRLDVSGAAFDAEFKGLERDRQRLEKLREKFPNETAKYDQAWSNVCGPAVPAPSVAGPAATPGRGKGAEAGLQRSAEPARESESEPSVVPESVHEVLRAPGQPLDGPTRGFMEARFGHDFSRVRVHTDTRASESARDVNAVAYTVGQNIAFDSGAYAPATPRGQRLLAHELMHVVQQRAALPTIQRETYYGGGYKQYYPSLDAELAAAAKKPTEWHPATPDMAATAGGSGGGESVSTFAELLTKLEAKGKGSVKILNLVGHSNSSQFSFGGEITRDNVKFRADASIESDALSQNAARIKALRDRFAPGAKIVLYSCDAGSGQGLLDAVGEAFGVCVEGFTTEIWWCLTKQKDGSADRGRVWAQNPFDVLSPDQPTDCKQFASDMRTLTHDGKSKQCGARKP